MMGATSRVNVIVPRSADADLLEASGPLCVFFPGVTERIPQTRQTTIPTAIPMIVLRRANELVGFEGTAPECPAPKDGGAGERKMFPFLFLRRERFRLMAVERDSGSPKTNMLRVESGAFKIKWRVKMNPALEEPRGQPSH